MRLAAFHHGENLEEDAPRYERALIDEKAKDEADPEHDDIEQSRQWPPIRDPEKPSRDAA